MKKFLLCLVLGATLGALFWSGRSRHREPALVGKAGALAGPAGEKAAGAQDAVVGKSRSLGDELKDARIVAVIKAKFFLDQDLSALAITIECHDGRVVLTGTAGSPELIRRALDIGRQTAGVRNVTSKLQVKN